VAAIGTQKTSSPSVLLSFVVPFYNSTLKSARLLSTLRGVTAGDVQVVCVDDGSCDTTLESLHGFAAEAAIPVVVLSQDNRGPGGARNTGLSAAQGEYVWFVDSDDDINLEAIELLRGIRGEDFDFIDFNFNIGARNAMFLTSGIHEFAKGEKASLVSNFGSLCTKIFSRAFINFSEFTYPEHCYFEDNGLSFTLALNTRRFYKSESEFYEVHLDFESVTRGSLSPRFYDRLYTAASGASAALPLTASEAERAAVAEAFRILFLNNTCRQLFGRMRLKRELGVAVAAREWAAVVRQLSDRINPVPWARTIIQAARVIRHYRSFAGEFGLSERDASILEGESARFQRLFRQSDLVSRVLPGQRKHFDRIRRSAWVVADD